MKCNPALWLALLCASCTDFPKDPEGTLNRIRSEGRFRVGIIAPLGLQKGNDPELAPFLTAVGTAASARPAVISGDAEPLLGKLKQGQLDLVIGRFEKKSPWSTLVEIGPPLRSERQGKTELLLAPVMRNGENAWIALVEAQARNAGANAR
jgi:hypothetical protein